MLRPGERIGVWVVDLRLGQTERSAVFRCHNAEDPSQRIAIKALCPYRPEWHAVRERLLRETESWFTFEHVNLPHMRGYSPWGPIPYLELTWVEGPTLLELSEGKPVQAERVAAWLRSAARAVAALHARGLRHRDIKLENLRMQADTLKLVDVGTASNPEELDPSSWPYAPPELGEPRAADSPTADLYALGVCAWELLRGSRAFRGGSAVRYAEHAAYKRAVGPLDPGPHVPIDLRKLVVELTHPHMNRRTRTATLLLEQLDGADLETTDSRLRLDQDSSPGDGSHPGPRHGDATWFPPDEEEEDSTEDAIVDDDSAEPKPEEPQPKEPQPEEPKPAEGAAIEPHTDEIVPTRTAERSDPRLMLAGIAALVLIAIITAAVLFLR